MRDMSSPHTHIYIINIKTLQQMRIYFFKSSNKSDKLSQLTIGSSSMLRAYARAVMYFKTNGYRGTPIRL